MAGSGWRGDITRLRELFDPTGAASRGWRGDACALARALGFVPDDWRDALRLFAQSHGIQDDDWRDGLCAAALRLGGPDTSGWRESLAFLCAYYQAHPPGADRPRRLRDCKVRALLDRLGRKLFVR